MAHSTPFDKYLAAQHVNINEITPGWLADLREADLSPKQLDEMVGLISNAVNDAVRINADNIPDRLLSIINELMVNHVNWLALTISSKRTLTAMWLSDRNNRISAILSRYGERFLTWTYLPLTNKQDIFTPLSACHDLGVWQLLLRLVYAGSLAHQYDLVVENIGRATILSDDEKLQLVFGLFADAEEREAAKVIEPDSPQTSAMSAEPVEPIAPIAPQPSAPAIIGLDTFLGSSYYLTDNDEYRQMVRSWLEGLRNGSGAINIGKGLDALCEKQYNPPHIDHKLILLEEAVYASCEANGSIDFSDPRSPAALKTRGDIKRIWQQFQLTPQDAMAFLDQTQCQALRPLLEELCPRQTKTQRGLLGFFKSLFGA